jgi:hypothetical protein
MQPYRESLAKVLTSPSAAEVWRLRADLLQAGLTADAKTWTVLHEFRGYLDRLETSTSSREYSHLASKLDIGAVGGVLVEHMVESENARELAVRLLSGILSEGLMVLATRQHVKAWEGELSAVYREAAWYLYGEIWRWAEELKPDLEPTERRALIDRLLDPVLSDDTPGLHRAVLVGRLFQLLLVSYLFREAGSGVNPSTT